MLAAMPRTSTIKRPGSALKLHRRATFGEVSNARRATKLAQKPALQPCGTAVAVKYPNVGVAPHLPRSTGRGGARNTASRESHELTTAQVANLIAAARHAEAIGLPFTRMITIHWQSAGVPLERMVNSTGKFVDLLSKAIARHGSTTAWLWVHENGHGKGAHCHLLAHVPAALVQRLTGLQRGWLRRITGQPYRPRVIVSKPIGGRLGLETSNPELQSTNARAALVYVIKGASPTAAKRFNLELLQPGGRIIGRRCSTSQNVGATARKLKDAL